MKKKITISVSEKVLNNVDKFIDRVYIRNRSQAIEHLIENSFGNERVAVILATGPLENLKIGKDEFRSTVKFGNIPVIEHALNNLRNLGFNKIFIAGERPLTTSIFSLIGDGKRYGLKISYIESENPRGSAESLRNLKGEVNTTFLIIYGDIIFDKNEIDRLWKHHFKHNGIATLMVSPSSLILGGIKKPIKASSIDIQGNSIIRAFPKESKKIKNLEKPELVFSSVFVAEPEILNYTGDSLENDVFPILAEKGNLYSYMGSEKIIHIHTKEDTNISIDKY
jgi:NDP-sugar pyrophosphorylase family protein